MTSKSFVDEFGDSLAKLPAELHRNFSLIQELDTRSENLMSDIDTIACNYMSNTKKNLKEEKKETMAIIQRKFDAVKELSDDKIQLSTQTCELVDHRILKLDSEIAKFKAKMKMKSEMGFVAFKAKEGTTKPIPSVIAVYNLTNPINNRSAANIAVKANSLTTGALVDGDMPIDRKEPKFCLCKDVSFGEMIGCDNPDCSIDWFHFACVNLIEKPDGTWFCPKCTKDEKKK